jgi:hypothetical protein
VNQSQQVNTRVRIGAFLPALRRPDGRRISKTKLGVPANGQHSNKVIAGALPLLKQKLKLQLYTASCAH